MGFTEEDVRKKFNERIKDDEIVLRVYENGSWDSIPISVFVSKFGDADLSLESLNSHPNSSDAWKQYFQNLFS